MGEGLATQGAHGGDAGAHRTPTASGSVSFELVVAETAPPLVPRSAVPGEIGFYKALCIAVACTRNAPPDACGTLSVAAR